MYLYGGLVGVQSLVLTGELAHDHDSWTRDIMLGHC